MRTSNRGRRLVTAAFGLALTLSACGASGATPPPTSQPAPVVTPDPHLKEPVAADDLYRLIATAGIRITPLTASKGADGEPVKRIIGTYDDWPIALSEYSSNGKLKTETKFDPHDPPGQGEAPYIIEGLNILIEFGPRITNNRSPAPPPSDKRQAMLALVAVLDPLLGPLQQRSVVPIPLSVAQSSPASAAAPTPKPSK
jgi:hypothetical protein